MDELYQPTLMAWYAKYRSDRASAGRRPTQSSIAEIAQLMAVDDLGGIDDERRRKASDLLWKPYVKKLHIAVGRQRTPPPRQLAWTIPLQPRVQTLKQEVRANRRAEEEAQRQSHLQDVAGIRFVDLAKFKDSFAHCGFWSATLDDLCKIKVVSGQVVESGAVRLKQKRRDAEEICARSTNPDLSRPCAPRDLYPAITVELTKRGYSSQQVDRYRRNPGRLLPDIARPETGKHSPVEVVLLILQEDPKDRPLKADPEQGSRKSA